MNFAAFYLGLFIICGLTACGGGGGGGGGGNNNGNGGNLSSSLSSLPSGQSTSSSSNSSNSVSSSSSTTTNIAPVARIKPATSASEFTQVTLDGSDSSDSDGTIVSYQWTQIGGQAVLLSHANTTLPSFIAPDVVIAEDLLFQLTVTDNKGLSNSATLRVTVTFEPNDPPIANAGADKSANPNTVVSLDASLSTDQDGSIIRYQWVQLSGASVTINRDTSSAADFIATQTGSYVFQVTVRDDHSVETSDSVTITVTNDNLLPIIQVPSTILRVNELATASISATSVSDPDGTIVQYAWSVNPQSKINVNLINGDKATVSFVAPEVSESKYVYLNLTVTDDKGGKTTSELIAAEIWPVTVAPIANAGDSQIVNAAKNVSLDGSASSHPNGIIVKYQWKQLQASNITIVNPSAVKAAFISPATDGLYLFELTVTDNYGNSDTDIVQVEVAANSLHPRTRRKANPARLSLNWNSGINADQFNIYYAKKVTVNSTNYNAQPSAVAKLNVTAPFELDAAFNEYQNTHFTVEAVKNGVVTHRETVVTEIKDISLSSNDEAGCTIEGNSVNCWGLEISDLEIKQLINPKKVSVGLNHACAIDDIGVFCWGDNIWKQTDVPKLNHPTFIAALNQQTCAIDDSGLHCWGFGSTDLPAINNPLAVANNCILNATNVACNNMIAQPPSLSSPKQLAVTGSPVKFACALDSNGVSCWGNSSEGRLNIPTLTKPTAVSVGYDHACALHAQGVSCWGGNDFGQTIVPALQNPTKIVTGYHTSCAIDDTGLVCWGQVFNTVPANLGHIDKIRLGGGICAISGGKLSCWAMPNIVPSLNNVTDVSLGDYTGCAQLNNDVRCWGGTNTWPTLSNPKFIQTSDNFGCALDDTGLGCWSTNPSPVTSNYPTLTGITSLQTGNIFACVINNSNLACWGDNVHDGLNTPSVSHPTDLSVGRLSACVIDNGVVKCWGSGDGFGETTPPPLSNPSQVSVGMLHACALDDKGVSCWGGATGGVVGETHVPILYHPIQVEAGSLSSCALDDFGLICWGSRAFNGFGWRATPRY